jgi:hypothetical protein
MGLLGLFDLLPPREKAFFQFVEVCTATSRALLLPTLLVGEDVELEEDAAPFKGEGVEDCFVGGINIVGAGRPGWP